MTSLGISLSGATVALIDSKLILETEEESGEIIKKAVKTYRE